MPSSKEVRARQNRQKERVAAARAERQRVQRRRRQVGGTAGVILLVVVVALGLALGGNNSGGKVAVAPTSTDAATTTTTLPSVKGKPCVGLKDPLPKGSPAFLVAPGPAPTKLGIQDLKVGTGAVVPKNSKVTVNYTGVACSTGKIFDSSYTTQPYDADLTTTSDIIQGLKQGVPGMRVGGVRVVSIPSSLAYGTVGKSPIAPDEALFFLVAVVKLG